eukprot:Awhi_evm1s386
MSLACFGCSKRERKDSNLNSESDLAFITSKTFNADEAPDLFSDFLGSMDSLASGNNQYNTQVPEVDFSQYPSSGFNF